MQRPQGSVWGSGHRAVLFWADGWSLGQVQLEVQKKWRQWHLHEFPLSPVVLSSSFSNGTKASTSEQSQTTCRGSVI